MRDNNLCKGSSKQWHSWQDKTGMPYALTYWYDLHIFSISGLPLETFSALSADELIDFVARHGLFLFCQNILNENEFPMVHGLIGNKKTTPFLSRSGGCMAMKCKVGRYTGYIVSAGAWGWNDIPDKTFLESLLSVFKLVGFQAVTPASTSEKLLASTLPEQKIYIPSTVLRRDILDNNVGGRIDKAVPGFHHVVTKYDKNKAYLHKSRYVVSPYRAPFHRHKPALEEIYDYPTGWWKCEIVASDVHIPPVQINGRKPVPGEVFERWLWTGEVLDCTEVGYQVKIQKGYGFPEMSNFMEQWSDVLWELYIVAEGYHEYARKILKSMMVGVPGRMLRRPEKLRLVHVSEATLQDIDIKIVWKEGGKTCCDWLIRVEPDNSTGQLSQVGSFIVAEMRRELYHEMLRFELMGHNVIMSYIDCISVDGIPEYYDKEGKNLGEYKSEYYWNMYSEENRWIAQKDPYSWEEDIMKYPGLRTLDQEVAFWRKYRQFQGNYLNI